MKTIVALIDFSDATEQIVQHAQTLAGAFHSRVVLLHVVPPQPEAVDLGLVSPVLMREPTAEQWGAHQTRLLTLRDSLAAAGLNVSAEQSPGITRDDILAETKRLNADLIILGSHHHGFLYDLFVGSVTQNIVKHATCPVLVIPQDAVPVEAAVAA